MASNLLAMASNLLAMARVIWSVAEALEMEEHQMCSIELPPWMEEDQLKALCTEEKANRNGFTPLPRPVTGNDPSIGGLQSLMTCFLFVCLSVCLSF